MYSEEKRRPVNEERLLFNPKGALILFLSLSHCPYIYIFFIFHEELVGMDYNFASGWPSILWKSVLPLLKILVILNHGVS